VPNFKCVAGAVRDLSTENMQFLRSNVPCFHTLLIKTKVTEQRSIKVNLANAHLDAQIFNTFITMLYMFRAISCSSSGSQIVVVGCVSRSVAYV
jgi:hypothetical protein